MPVISAQEAWLNGTAVTVPGQDLSVYNWRTSFTESGDIFVAPGTVLRFSSEGHETWILHSTACKTRSNAPDWNGIVETNLELG